MAIMQPLSRLRRGAAFALLGLAFTGGAASAAGPSAVAPRFVERLRAASAESASQRYDQPGAALRFYWQKRTPDGKPIPVRRYFTALAAMQQMPQRSSVDKRALPPRAFGPPAAVDSQAEAATTGTWEPLGPGNIGGRTRALVIDPRHSATMFAGGVAGGVWRSDDGGASWRPIGDLLPNLAVNSLVMDPKNSNVLYAGTGEGYFNIDAVRGAGIFKTTNGGATWAQLGATDTADFHFVNDLVVSNVNSNRVYAATSTGVWRSVNGGRSWTRVLARTPGTFGGCLDLALRSDTATDVLFVSCNTFSQAEIWRSTKAEIGRFWTRVLSQREMGRTALAIAPSNQNVVYALGASNKSNSPYQDGFYALFRSDSGGDNGSFKATLRNTSPDKLSTLLLTNPVIASLKECQFDTANFFFNQGWYDNVIAVDPKNPDIVWAGGIDLFRSDNGGKSFGVASYWWATDSTGPAPSFAHADQHAIVFDPHYDGAANQRLFVGNDGGLFRTDTARAATARGLGVCDPGKSAVVFSNLNHGYAVTQFYHGLPYPDGKSYFGGTQDNGTLRGNDTDGAAWQEINGGDGGWVAIDPEDTDTLYTENTGNSIQKSTDGGASFAAANDGIVDPGFLFIAPFTMDASDAKTLYTGGAYIWRTVDGAEHWARASDFVAGSNNSLVSAIAVAPSDSNHVLVGLTEGYIHFSAAARATTPTTAWSFSRPREGYVSSVTFAPQDASVAYATYSTFGGTHVWKSSDGGRTWSALDGSGDGTLPDIPVQSLAIDPEDNTRLFVGTDLGVFVSVDGGSTWEIEATGFPNVVTDWLAVRPSASGSEIYAFTHGRGAWRAKLR